MFAKILNAHKRACALLVFFLMGCNSGGDLVSPNEVLSPIFLQTPTVSVPSQAVHFSNQQVLTISGLCNTGFTVRLSEIVPIGDFVCTNSAYSFSVDKPVDGYYSFTISQSHPDYGTSTPVSLIWIKKSSISNPQVTSPAQNPYASGATTFNLIGQCETGATVVINGGGVGSAVCTLSTFNITVTNFAEGNHSLTIEQRDQAGNVGQTAFVWQRALLRISPAAPQVIAGLSTVFTPTGGSLQYTSSLLTNNSGASYDSMTQTYTAGPLAGVSDTLRFEDSLGERVDVVVQVVAGIPDHFTMPLDSNDFQEVDIGETSLPLKVEVVDAYENPVPNIPVIFNILSGDGSIVGNPQVSTDASGAATAQVKVGYGSPRIAIGVKSAGSVFPDVVMSGNARISLSIFAIHRNNGALASLIPVATNPTDLEMGDFNSDGHQDLAVLNTGDPSIGLMYGRGNGLFEPMTKIIPICSGPSAFTTADFSGNGYKEFAIACGGSDRIAFILRDAQGDFLPVSFINVDAGETFPVDIAVADMDGDTILDIVTVSAGSQVISVRHGTGGGAFAAATQYAVGSGPSAVGIIDIDKDGRKDLAILNAGEATVGILMNNSLGGFFGHYSFPIGQGPAALRVGDFNQDTFDDVVVANNIDGDIHVLLNDQFSGFVPNIITNIGSSPVALTVTNMDGDAFPDVIVTSSDVSAMTVLLGRGDGTFDSHTTQNTTLNPVAVVAGDVNGDTITDVFISGSGDNKLQTFIGSGGGDVGLQISVENNPTASKLADVDEDGIQDLIIVQQGTNRITVLKGNRLGLWTPLTTIATSVGPTEIDIEDVDNDGHVDFVVTHQATSNIRVYFGNGLGGFSSPSTFATAQGPLGVALRDLNSDGLVDAVVACSSGNVVSVLYNAGARVFNNKVDYPVGSQPTSVVVADLNGDYALDIVTANQIPGSISVLLSTGNDMFQAQLEYTSGSGTQSLIAGYLNGDTIVDIAAVNENDGTVSVFLGLGTGSFMGPTTFFAGTPATNIMQFDFNGNRQADLMVVNGASETATILYGSGNGLFNTTVTLNLGHAASLLSFGDINDDARLDFITVDRNIPNLKTWTGQ